jgi:hypothetical protein
MQSDFVVIGNNGDTVFLLSPQTSEALLHLQEHTGESSWLGDSLAVEHRYVCDIVSALQREGFTVRRGR